MNKFVSGDVVTDGKLTGVIGESFYWRDSDDGTLNEPKTDYLPVTWDNGTQGYRHISELQYA